MQGIAELSAQRLSRRSAPAGGDHLPKPAWTKRVAAARPKPDVAPVMKAVRVMA